MNTKSSELCFAQRTDVTMADIQAQNIRLAEATAEAAEAVAELEEINLELSQKNKALGQANSWAAELVAELQLKDHKIRLLNQGLSKANAESAEMMAEIDSQLNELQTLNKKHQQSNAELEAANEGLIKYQTELKQQSRKLVNCERQRVMIESIGTACHHLGQPFTSITMCLELLRSTNKDPEEIELIEMALKEAGHTKTIFERLRLVHEYHTEPYVMGAEGSDRIITL